MAERAGGEGEFVCRMDGSALDDWQRKGERGKDDVLCGNEARAEDEVEGRKRLLRPRQAQPRMRTKRNMDLTRREYCYDLRRTTFATTATAFHCTRWVVVVVASPPGSAGTPDFPLRLARFSHALPIYLPFPVSPLPLPLAHPPCSTSQTPPLPYTPFGTSDSSTSSATRGLPSPV